MPPPQTMLAAGSGAPRSLVVTCVHNEQCCPHLSCSHSGISLCRERLHGPLEAPYSCLQMTNRLALPGKQGEGASSAPTHAQLPPCSSTGTALELISNPLATAFTIPGSPVSKP